MSEITISEEEWKNTPPSIQNVIQHLINNSSVSRKTLIDHEIDSIIRNFSHSKESRVEKQVVMITKNVTNRMHKYCKELHKLGWQIILLCIDEPNLTDYSCFARIIKCPDVLSVIEEATKLNPQIYHCYSSWYVELPSLIIRSKLKPVVFDNYDVLTGCVDYKNIDQGMAKIVILEQFCLENSTGISARDGRIRIARKKSGIKTPPLTLCIDGAQTQQEAIKSRRPKRTDAVHAVYAGNMADPFNEEPRNFHFKLGAFLGMHGIKYHIYPSSQFLYDQYSSFFNQCTDPIIISNMEIHKSVNSDMLVGELSQYHIGIDIITTSINRTPDDHSFYTMDITNYGLDNKVFDYINAGLFTLSYDAKWINRIVKRYGLGTNVTSFDDILSKIHFFKDKEFPQIPYNITTEYCAKKLVNMYSKLSKT